MNPDRIVSIARLVVRFGAAEVRKRVPIDVQMRRDGANTVRAIGVVGVVTDAEMNLGVKLAEMRPDMVRDPRLTGGVLSALGGPSWVRSLRGSRGRVEAAPAPPVRLSAGIGPQAPRVDGLTNRKMVEKEAAHGEMQARLAVPERKSSQDRGEWPVFVAPEPVVIDREVWLRVHGVFDDMKRETERREWRQGGDRPAWVVDHKLVMEKVA